MYLCVLTLNYYGATLIVELIGSHGRCAGFEGFLSLCIDYLGVINVRIHGEMCSHRVELC